MPGAMNAAGAGGGGGGKGLSGSMGTILENKADPWGRMISEIRYAIWLHK